MTRHPIKVVMALIVACGVGAPTLHAALFAGPPSEPKIRERLTELPKEGKSRTKALLRSDLGTLLYEQGKMREAAYEFEKALDEDTSRSMKRHIYLYLGKSYESFERPDKAIAAYEQALAYDPKNWRRHRDLA